MSPKNLEKVRMKKKLRKRRKITIFRGMVGNNFVDLFYLVNSLAYLKFTFKGNKLVYLKKYLWTFE